MYKQAAYGAARGISRVKPNTWLWILLLLFFWWKRKDLPFISDFFKTPEEKADDKAEKDIQDLPVDDGNLTLPKPQYTVLAKEIYDAANGCGTYEDDIQAVFDKMVTNDDIIQLSKAYGMRETSCWATGGSDGKRGLAQMLRSELDPSEYADIFGKLSGAGL